MLALSDTGQEHALSNWVQGVAPIGTFFKNANVTKRFTRGDSGVPPGWNIETYGTSSINLNKSDSKIEDIYTIDGRKIDKITKGLNIIKDTDKTRKVLIR